MEAPVCNPSDPTVRWAVRQWSLEGQLAWCSQEVALHTHPCRMHTHAHVPTVCTHMHTSHSVHTHAHIQELGE